MTHQIRSWFCDTAERVIEGRAKPGKGTLDTLQHGRRPGFIGPPTMRNLRRKMDTRTVVLSTFSANQMDIPLTADPCIFKAPADVHFFYLAHNA